MSLAERVRYPQFHNLIMAAEAAAALIPHGVNVGMSGFTGAGYPKALPQAIAERAPRPSMPQGKPYKINVWTGASTAPECDGALAASPRHGSAPALQHRPHRPPADQCGRDRLHRHAPVARGPARLVWLLRQDERGGDRGAGRNRRWPAHPLHRRGQQQNLAGDCRQGDPGSEHQAARRDGGHARHLLRHRHPAPAHAHLA